MPDTLKNHTDPPHDLLVRVVRDDVVLVVRTEDGDEIVTVNIDPNSAVNVAANLLDASLCIDPQGPAWEVLKAIAAANRKDGAA